MKNGVWIGGLALSLGGWTSAVFGQDVIWRAPSAPQPVASTVLNTLQPCPAVTLGKPVLLPARGTADVSAAVLRPASFSESAGEGRGPSVGSEWSDDADKGEPADKGTDFAADRPEAPPSVVAASSTQTDLRLVPVAAGDASKPPTLLPRLDQGCASAPCMPMADSEDVRYPKWYLSGEYLLWWLKPDVAPPLASTSTNPFDNGIIGQPTTQVLFGGDLDGSARSGFRVTAGWWLDETCRDDAIEARGFYLASRSTTFNANSSQFPVVARPFFNINMNEEFAQLTAFPGVATGNLGVNEESHLWGAEVNARCRICSGCDYRLDVFGGFRYLDLEEWLAIAENGLNAANAPPPFPGDRFLVQDFFLTRNQFYGGQLGLIAEYDRGPFSIEARGQVALGDTHQNILIDGDQTFTDPNSTTHVFRGGLLALSSNIGRFTRDRFSVVPEVNLNVGYQATDHIRVFVGYDFLYWNNVVRPGGQIDRNIDITLIPNFPVPGAVPTGQNRPSAPQSGSDFWAQGVTVGLEIRY